MRFNPWSQIRKLIRWRDHVLVRSQVCVCVCVNHLYKHQRHDRQKSPFDIIINKQLHKLIRWRDHVLVRSQACVWTYL